MRRLLKSLFSDSGDISMMRVLSLISLIVGSYLAIVGHDTSVGIFITAAFAGKTAQKIIEKR